MSTSSTPSCGSGEGWAARGHQAYRDAAMVGTAARPALVLGASAKPLPPRDPGEETVAATAEFESGCRWSGLHSEDTGEDDVALSGQRLPVHTAAGWRRRGPTVAALAAVAVTVGVIAVTAHYLNDNSGSPAAGAERSPAPPPAPSAALDPTDVAFIEISPCRRVVKPCWSMSMP